MKKRIFSMALALMMMLSICVVSVSAEETTASTNLVYYDLQDKDPASCRTTTSAWKPTTSSGYSSSAGGFVGRDNYSYATITEETNGKVLELKATFQDSENDFSRFALKMEGLNAGDYSVPLRKVTMGFKTSVPAGAESLYDAPAKLWFNLWAVSAKGLKLIEETENHTMPESLKTAIMPCLDTDLILFFWDVKAGNTNSRTMSNSGYSGTLYPIANIGTVGQDYTGVEYIYEVVSADTILTKGIRIDSEVKNTLMDGTTPVSDIAYKEKGADYYYPGVLYPEYDPENLSTYNLVSMMGCYNDPNGTVEFPTKSERADRTSIWFNELRFEGLRELTFEASHVAKIVDDEKATATITLTNYPGIALDGALVFAVYDGDTLVGTSIDSAVSLPAEIGATYENTLTVENEAFADTSKTFSYKIFLLDSMNNLVPLKGELSGDL